MKQRLKEWLNMRIGAEKPKDAMEAHQLSKHYYHLARRQRMFGTDHVENMTLAKKFFEQYKELKRSGDFSDNDSLEEVDIDNEIEDFSEDINEAGYERADLKARARHIGRKSSKLRGRESVSSKTTTRFKQRHGGKTVPTRAAGEGVPRSTGATGDKRALGGQGAMLQDLHDMPEEEFRRKYRKSKSAARTKLRNEEISLEAGSIFNYKAIEKAKAAIKKPPSDDKNKKRAARSRGQWTRDVAARRERARNESASPEQVKKWEDRSKEISKEIAKSPRRKAQAAAMRKKYPQATQKYNPNPTKEDYLPENSITVSMHKSGTKYKVHGVHKSIKGQIKPGEHLSDTHIDDLRDSGVKIRHVKPKSTPKIPYGDFVKKTVAKEEEEQKSSIGTPLKHKRSWNPKTHKLIVKKKGMGVKVVPKSHPGMEAESVNDDIKETTGSGWWNTKPDEHMSRAYWQKSKIPPSDRATKHTNYQKIVQHLHKKNPAPKHILDKHMNHYAEQAHLADRGSEDEPTHAVTFTKGTKVGARSHRTVYVVAHPGDAPKGTHHEDHAINVAKKHRDYPGKEYKVSHVRLEGLTAESGMSRVAYQKQSGEKSSGVKTFKKKPPSKKVKEYGVEKERELAAKGDRYEEVDPKTGLTPRERHRMTPEWAAMLKRHGERKNKTKKVKEYGVEKERELAAKGERYEEVEPVEDGFKAKYHALPALNQPIPDRPKHKNADQHAVHNKAVLDRHTKAIDRHIAKKSRPTIRHSIKKIANKVLNKEEHAPEVVEYTPYAYDYNRKAWEESLAEVNRYKGRSGHRVTKPEKEEPEHIIMQMRKVQSLKKSHSGVEFNDGTKVKINPGHARQVLNRHDSAEKPSDKENIARTAAHSHAGLQHVASGKDIDDKSPGALKKPMFKAAARREPLRRVSHPDDE